MTENEKRSTVPEDTERRPVLKPPADKEDEATVLDPEINLRNDLNNKRSLDREVEE